MLFNPANVYHNFRNYVITLWMSQSFIKNMIIMATSDLWSYKRSALCRIACCLVYALRTDASPEHTQTENWFLFISLENWSSSAKHRTRTKKENGNEHIYEIFSCSFFIFIVFALLTFYPRLNGFFVCCSCWSTLFSPFHWKIEKKPTQEKKSFKMDGNAAPLMKHLNL